MNQTPVARDITRSKLRKIMYIGLGIASFVVCVHWFANEYSLYWLFNWLDIPAHMFGGFTAALGIIWLIEVIRLYQGKDLMRYRSVIIFALLGALFIGLLWEFLECSYGLSGFSGIYFIDTIADLFNDMIGGVLGALCWHMLIK